MTDLDMLPVHVRLGGAPQASERWKMKHDVLNIFPTPLTLQLASPHPDVYVDAGRIHAVHLEDDGLIHGSGVLNLRLEAARTIAQKIETWSGYPLVISWNRHPDISAAAAIVPDRLAVKMERIWTVPADLDMAQCPCRT